MPSHRIRRPTARPALLAGAAAFTLVALAAPASAHVTVQADSAVAGGFGKLTFRVPNERDDASTTKVDVAFPADAPLAFVSVQPLPGWSFTVAKSRLAQPIRSDDGDVTEAVSRITWTATAPANAIKPGEFQDFDVSAGPLPKAPSMQFKALQTYSDGQVVRWIEATPAGGPEPEHPAPVLRLAAAPATATAGTVASAATAAPVVAAGSASDGTARVLGAVGIGLAVLLGGAGLLLALRRPRRQ